MEERVTQELIIKLMESMEKMILSSPEIEFDTVGELPDGVKLDKKALEWLEDQEDELDRRHKELDKKVRQADDRRKKWNQKNKELKKNAKEIEGLLVKLKTLVERYGDMENSAELLANSLMEEEE